MGKAFFVLLFQKYDLPKIKGDHQLVVDGKICLQQPFLNTTDDILYASRVAFPLRQIKAAQPKFAAVQRR